MLEKHMANLTGILGSMLATGMGGRSRRGPSFASSPFGMAGGSAMGMSRGGGGFKQAAGLGALGYLAYKAYQEYQRNNPSGSGPSGSGPSGSGSSGSGSSGEGLGGILGGVLGGSTSAPSQARAQAPGGGSSLGDRIAGMLRPEQQQPEPPPEAALDDRKALLLIRAMIAAAAADGQIDADERARILSNLDQAGADAEDHRFVEKELAAPQPIDGLLKEVQDQETAEQVYLASEMAIEVDSPAERSYLQYLAARLNLDPDRVAALNKVV
jgi:uncharacterized membrane protein YebE (DUF533 family)